MKFKHVRRLYFKTVFFCGQYRHVRWLHAVCVLTVRLVRGTHKSAAVSEADSWQKRAGLACTSSACGFLHGRPILLFLDGFICLSMDQRLIATLPITLLSDCQAWVCCFILWSVCIPLFSKRRKNVEQCNGRLSMTAGMGCKFFSAYLTRIPCVCSVSPKWGSCFLDNVLTYSCYCLISPRTHSPTAIQREEVFKNLAVFTLINTYQNIL